MASLEEAKVLLEEGWKAREALDFDTAREKLTKSRETFEKAGDFRLVTEALNHLAYTEKLAAGQSANLALKLAKESENIAEKNNIDPILTYRAIISTAETAGLFEVSLKYAEKILPLLQKPILKGDLYAHIASLELRTGKLEQAGETIGKSLLLIEEGWDSEREPHRSIWKLKTMITQALIAYNMGNKTEAMETFHNARQIALEQDLKPRLAQIEILIDSL